MKPIFTLSKIIGFYLLTITMLQAQSMNLQNYTQVGTSTAVIPSNIELSGLTFSPISNTFFSVDDGTGNIFELDLNGNRIRTITTSGFNDLEGIVHISGNMFAVAEERRWNIVFVTITSTTTTISYPSTIVQLLNDNDANPNPTNNGLEGIAYNPTSNTIYTIAEKSDMKFYDFTVPSSYTGTLLANEPFDLQTLAMFQTMFSLTDVSGLHYAPNGNVLILSDESDVLFEVDPATGAIISFLNLPAADAHQYEGVTIDDNGCIYIVSEPNIFYTYCTDTDGDGILDPYDNCVYIPNVNQTDSNGNNIGNACEPQTICSYTWAGTDDAEEHGTNGTMNVPSFDLDMVYDAGDALHQYVGLRFDFINIPQGANIFSAKIQFTAEEVLSGATAINFKTEAVNDALPFSATPFNISSRAVNSNTVTWNPNPWTLYGERGPDQLTVDLAPIVQEVIDRPGFAANNALAFVLTGTGDRTAFSFEGTTNTLEYPELCIRYTPKNCINVLIINNAVNNGLYEAVVRIESDAVVQSNQVVDYHAGTCIELDPDFEVILGAEFTAEILGCSN